MNGEKLNTLGLDDDLDSIELLIEVENEFGIKISDEEAGVIFNLGQLYDTICGRMQKFNGKNCATSMVFYRLRQAIAPLSSQKQLRPTTRLADMSQLTPRAFFYQIQSNCDLTLPNLDWTKIGNFGLILLWLSLGSLPLLFFFADNLYLMLSVASAGIIASFILLKADPRAYSAEQTTFGDLTKQTLIHNYGRMAREGALVRPDDIWNTLVKIAAPYALDIEANEISQSTIILQSYANTLASKP